MKLKSLLTWLAALATVAAMSLTACSDTKTTDDSEFKLYYSGLTDIGPSMNGVISSPTYKGSAPSNYAITDVKLEGVSGSREYFTIDGNEGSISVMNTAEMEVGLYSISVSCMSGGRYYAFDDIVEVNMMKPVPDGITVEPNFLQASYTDILTGSNLPTAQIKTDGDHVSITGYAIVNGPSSQYFTVSNTGLISIVSGDTGMALGTHTISLKLTTRASEGDPQAGIFEDALTVEVVSAPIALTYTPETLTVETTTAFESAVPVLLGSKEGVAYSVKSVEPQTDQIRINAETGVIYAVEGNTLASGNTYVVSVNVINSYTEAAGVDFNAVFSLKVVDFVVPIANFAYENASYAQADAISINVGAAFEGTDVTFEFVDRAASLAQLSIDETTGKITAAAGNTIAKGVHTIKVKASNLKGEATTEFTLTITANANPNYFTYLRYGNNLGLAPAENYPNQYRYAAGSDVQSGNIAPATDAPTHVTYSMEIKYAPTGSAVTIDSATGEITVTAATVNQIGVVIVTATADDEANAPVSVSVPVFFRYTAALTEPVSGNSVTVDYTPFVFHVNPKTGGRFASTVTTEGAAGSIYMDYRRTFRYHNINGNFVEGALSSGTTNFMSDVWDSYYAAKGSSANYGSKAPMSYYQNTGDLSVPLAYVDAADLSIVVNPEKWVAGGVYADGFVIGQITFSSSSTESNINSGAQNFPVVIWLDPAL